MLWGLKQKYNWVLLQHHQIKHDILWKWQKYDIDQIQLLNGNLPDNFLDYNEILLF